MALVTRTDHAADRVPPMALVIAGAALGAVRRGVREDRCSTSSGPAATCSLRLALRGARARRALAPAARAATRAPSCGSPGSFGLTLGAMNLELLRVARPDPAGHRRDDRVPRAAGRRGRRVAARARRALGRARGARHPAALGRRRRPDLDTRRRRLRAGRRAVLGGLHPAQRRASARSSRAAAGSRSRCVVGALAVVAGRGRRRRRRRSWIPRCWPPASRSRSRPRCVPYSLELDAPAAAADARARRADEPRPAAIAAVRPGCIVLGPATRGPRR